MITTDVTKYPAAVQPYAQYLDRRSMLVQKTNKLDVECIVRGYLAGSGWKDYKKTRSICGIQLPEGLRESEKLPEPIFTPTTKEDEGHDQNITFEQFSAHLGEPLAKTLRAKSIELYEKANEYAQTRGFILADTKFEFGLVGGQPILIDEALTPDSSRFWDAKKYEIGKSQDSFDKQIVRDYLEGINWDKKPPVPSLPQDIIDKTRRRYIDAYEGLTGEKF